MRKLAWLAVLAVLFAPTLASAQLSLGARLGYAFAMGEAGEGDDLADYVKGQIPFQFDIGYRATPALTLGGYVSLGLGLVGDAFQDACDLEDIDCSAAVFRLGVQVDYAFRGPSVTPWIGAGIGYEWTRITAEADGMKDTFSLSGFEFLHLQGGLDWRLGQKFSLGPFAMVTLGQYRTASIDDMERDIDDKGIHQWLQLGVRGRFDL